MLKKISSINPKKQIVIGSIISYCLLALDFGIALFLPKWINSVIGQETYGVYTLSNSLITLFLIDFGLGAASSKFLSKLVVDNNSNKEKDYLSIIYKIYLIIDIFIAVVFLIIYLLMDKIYAGLNKEQLNILKILFPIMAVYNLINFPFITLNGSLISHEQFIAYKGFSLIQKILYTILVSIFLALKLNVFYISIASVISGIVILILKYWFCYSKCNMHVNIKYWDSKIAKKILGFSIWITIGMIASKLIASFMPSILGIVSNATNIAVYGYAYALQTNAYALTIVVASMTLPKVTKLMKGKITANKEVDNLVIKVGKIQFFIIGLFFSGFIMFGKEFLLIIMGNQYINSYYCFILLFLPSLISATLEVCENVAKVSNQIKELSIIKISSAACILGTSFYFGKLYGALGVCTCFAVFQIIAYLLITILIYYKKNKMNIKRIFCEVYLPTIIPALVAAICFVILKYFGVSFSKIVPFILGVFGFSIIYIGLYYLVSLKPHEKVMVYKKFAFRHSNIKSEENTNNYFLFKEDKIIFNDSKIIKLAVLPLNEPYKIFVEKYGYFYSDKQDENKSYFICINKENYKTSHAGVFICNKTVFKLIKNYNQYDKIIILEEKK